MAFFVIYVTETSIRGSGAKKLEVKIFRPKINQNRGRNDHIQLIFLARNVTDNYFFFLNMFENDCDIPVKIVLK